MTMRYGFTPEQLANIIPGDTEPEPTPLVAEIEAVYPDWRGSMRQIDDGKEGWAWIPSFTYIGTDPRHEGRVFTALSMGRFQEEIFEMNL